MNLQVGPPELLDTAVWMKALRTNSNSLTPKELMERFGLSSRRMGLA